MKKTKNKSMKKSVLTIVLLFVVLVLILSYSFSQKARSSISTEVVLTGTAEDKFSADGYIIRDEFVVNAPATGVISFRADDGKRVSRGSTIAVIYTGDVDSATKSELSSIHERINEIEGSSAEKNLYAGDSVGGASQITNNIDAIMRAVYERETTSVPQYKDDITRLIRHEGEQGGTALTTLEQLQARKAELEATISGNATAVYAPVSGVLCSKLDGYEEYFNISCIENINSEYLKKRSSASKNDAEEAQKDIPCFKLVNNYEWYYAADIDEKWAEDIKEGASISLRFPEISDEKLDGEVYRLSEPNGDKVTIVIKSSSLFSGLYTDRKLSAEIVRKTYRGFKVSKEAIHIDEDGKYFVYVNSEGIAKKRNVEILYSDDVYAIIKENNSASNNLLLYDEVIVSGSNVKEGKSL